MFLSRVALMLAIIAMWRHYVLPLHQERSTDAKAVEDKWMYLWTTLTMLLCA